MTRWTSTAPPPFVSMNNFFKSQKSESYRFYDNDIEQETT
jgi:hypothetical protein